MLVPKHLWTDDLAVVGSVFALDLNKDTSPHNAVNAFQDQETTMTKARIEPGKTDISIRNKEKPGTHQDHDPRAELGLRSPEEVSESSDASQSRLEAEGQKATRFDGHPNPQGAASDTLKPRDDTPMKLEKKEGPRDDQGDTRTSPKPRK